MPCGFGLYSAATKHDKDNLKVQIQHSRKPDSELIRELLVAYAGLPPNSSISHAMGITATRL